MIQPGDILAIRGKGWLSEGILKAEYGDSIPVSGVSHVGIFVAGDPIPVVIEALHSVLTNPLAKSIADCERAFLIHDTSLTLAQRQSIVDIACTFSAKDYGYVDIAAQGLDAITHVMWWTNALGGYLKHFPICSFVVASAYDKIGLNFGIPDASCKPSDIMTFAETHPQYFATPSIIF